MSRRTIEAHEPGRYEVAVGWDEPMQTFFAQVHDMHVPDHEEDLVFWIGYQNGQVPEPEMLADALENYADVPEGVVEALREDKRLRRMA